MRTTLEIEDDVLAAAKEIAGRQGSTAGRVISELARKGLAAGGKRGSGASRSGVPLVRSRGEIVTIEHLTQLADEEGI